MPGIVPSSSFPACLARLHLGYDGELGNTQHGLNGAHSGPYKGLKEEDALSLLAERVEEKVSTEHAKWVSERRQQAEQQGQQDRK